MNRKPNVFNSSFITPYSSFLQIGRECRYTGRGFRHQITSGPRQAGRSFELDRNKQVRELRGDCPGRESILPELQRADGARRGSQPRRFDEQRNDVHHPRRPGKLQGVVGEAQEGPRGREAERLRPLRRFLRLLLRPPLRLLLRRPLTTIRRPRPVTQRRIPLRQIILCQIILCRPRKAARATSVSASSRRSS